jgi:hypothetical protein
MSKKTSGEVDIYDDSNLQPNNWIKFSVVGDNVNGTLTAVRETISRLPGKEGQKTKVYEIKTDGGAFHNVKDKKIDTEPTDVAAGEIWNVGGGIVLDRQMQNVKRGQKIGIKFTEERPNKNAALHATKIKRVYTPKNLDGTYKMDTEWLKQDAEANNTLENY